MLFEVLIYYVICILHFCFLMFQLDAAVSEKKSLEENNSVIVKEKSEMEKLLAEVTKSRDELSEQSKNGSAVREELAKEVDAISSR